MSVATPEDVTNHQDSHERRNDNGNDNDDHDERAPLLPKTPDSTLRISRARYASIATISVLIVLLILGLIFGFIVPNMAQKYLMDTLDYNISSVNLEGITDKGADVRVTGSIFLNETKSTSKVAKRLTNTLLRIAGPIQISEAHLAVFLKHNGSHHIASTMLDSLSLSLANSKQNSFNMLSAIELKNPEILGKFANSVLNHEVTEMPLQAVVDAKITRFISTRKTVSRSLRYPLPDSITGIPPYNITQLLVKDMPNGGIEAAASIAMSFVSPIDAALPSVVLQASIVGCKGQLIPIAIGYNQPFQVTRGTAAIEVEGLAKCEAIPAAALEECRGTTRQSPLDSAMQTFLAGNDTIVHVSGAQLANNATWLQTLLLHMTVPISVPGSQSQQFARDIALSDVKFNLPSFFGGGGKPKISGKVRGIIDIPEGIEVDVKVDSVHVLADLLYKKKKFAYVESPGWAPASSLHNTRKELSVEVNLKDAPVTITNDEVFSAVVSQLLGGKVLLDVVGFGDVKVGTSVGKVEAHRLPIEAQDIEVGGFGFLGDIKPQIANLGVLQTTDKSMELVIEAEVDNPTGYEASAAYLDMLLTFQNQTLGNMTVENVKIIAGSNRITARVRYAPTLYDDGKRNAMTGSQMLSEYLSEQHVNITLQAHGNSIPDYPNLSNALAYLPLQISLPVPRLINADPDDGNGDDDGGGTSGSGPTGSQFLVAAKFHLFSSTASFILRNPLNETVTITELHAQARYHDDIVGVLDYGYPITLSGTDPETETTRLPVTWKLPPSDILRKAVRGTLRVNATAQAVIAVGRMGHIPVNLTLHEVGAGVGL